MLIAATLHACGGGSGTDATSTPADTSTTVAPHSSELEPTTTTNPRPGPTTTTISERLSAAEIYSLISPSIPFIETATSAGSGILIEDGYIVTNYHVVWPHTEAWVIFPDGTELSNVPVAGWDPFAELAVLGPVNVSAPPLSLADGESMTPGSSLFLVGYPAETEQFPEASITQGILSRFREWDTLGITLLQTDAAISGGQSGGALVNDFGEVVGISTWIFSDADFAVATSATDDALIVESLIQDSEANEWSDRRFPAASGSSTFDIELAGIWDTRAFAFTGEAGSIVQAQIDGPGDGVLWVPSPYGPILEVNESDTGLEHGSVELLDDGIHYLVVAMESPDPSAFALNSSIELTLFDDPDDGRTIYAGQMVGGVIDYYSDWDWSFIDLDEGDTVVVWTDAIATDTVITIGLASGDYSQFVYDDDSGSSLFGGSTNAELIYAAPTSGRYVILVQDAVDAAGGAYFLGVEYIAADTALDTSTTPNPVATPAPTPFRIAFNSERDGNMDVYVMNADGSGQTRLTDNPALDAFPSWSPDSSRIAFVSERDGNFEVYVMNADGSSQTRLTDNPGEDFLPNWSPDGSRIAYASRRGGNMEIYVMNADGSSQTRLTDPAHDLFPSWSPDGSRVAFISKRDENFDVYVVNADGSSQTRLTDDPEFDGAAIWSPDGSRIAFGSDRDGNSEIYVMNADGSDQTRLTDNTALDIVLNWSPDGSRIVFVSERDGNVEVYVMNADGSGQTRLTDNPGEDFVPSWSPDGSRIAYASERDGNMEIYVMNADGSDQTRLTDNPGEDLLPIWSLQ